MTVLQRTDLTTSQKIQCAAAAVAGQHTHGSKTALSETYEISRPTSLHGTRTARTLPLQSSKSRKYTASARHRQRFGTMLEAWAQARRRCSTSDDGLSRAA